RGFDICSFLPEKCHRAPASDAVVVVLRRVRHFAATSPRGQRRPPYFSNRALALTISELHRPWATAPYLRAFLNDRRAIRLNPFLSRAQVYEPEFLILRKVTLKLIRLRLPDLNGTSSCALQHRHNCGRHISNSILHPL